MWANWAGTQRCDPVAIERPGSAREVEAAVRRAIEAGRTVRAAGAGHSFSAVVPTDGTLVDLRRLDRILDADGSGLVEVEAGITLAALNAGLQERGLALPNLGDIDAQSLAGALATGTHGTGVGRFPLEEAARIMVGAARAHEGSLERIVFAVHGDAAERAFRDALD